MEIFSTLLLSTAVVTVVGLALWALQSWLSKEDEQETTMTLVKHEPAKVENTVQATPEMSQAPAPTKPAPKARKKTSKVFEDAADKLMASVQKPVPVPVKVKAATKAKSKKKR